MTILAREIDYYPDGLFDLADVGLQTGASWWALYTLARREKELMRRLKGLNIGFYSPIIPRRKRTKAGGLQTSYIPLFAGYVFMFGDEQARYQALTTNCISRWLPVPDGKELTADLRQIRRLIEDGSPLTTEARLESGMRVRIRTGPLAGMEGTLLQRRDQNRLLVAVNFLKQGASILAADYDLEEVV